MPPDYVLNSFGALAFMLVVIYCLCLALDKIRGVRTAYRWKDRWVRRAPKPTAPRARSRPARAKAHAPAPPQPAKSARPPRPVAPPVGAKRAIRSPGVGGPVPWTVDPASTDPEGDAILNIALTGTDPVAVDAAWTALRTR